MISNENNQINELNNNGYIIIKTLSKEEQKYGLSCMKHDMVDYTLLKSFIDDYFLPKIPFSDPIYLKARISNNNNSTDAAVLHSDIYNYTSERTIPMYTALCYFDKAELELVPGSHIMPRTSFSEDNDNRTVLHLEPGDIVVFNAVISHRGVNFSNGANRRVLQVFELFPTRELHDQNVSKFLTCDTSPKKRGNKNLLYYVAQVKWLIEIVNFVGYYLSFYDLKYKVVGMDLPPWQKKGRYISYEPGGRVDYKEGLVDKNNVNVIFNDSEIIKYSHFYAWIMFICFFIIILLIVYKFRNKIGKVVKLPKVGKVKK
jgi:hypothetical protein|uniref:Phytanoyl-CoA dioxygenase n=1 Tax=viral metagenome TaxID=1070528 RepID=A0A6C0D2P3_9ZZZZ